MDNKVLHDVFIKTMKTFEDYSYGFRKETDEERGIITIITPNHEIELYDSYEEWLDIWGDDILQDLQDGIIYIDKKEILELLEYSVKHANGYMTDTIKKYLLEEKGEQNG